MTKEECSESSRRPPQSLREQAHIKVDRENQCHKIILWPQCVCAVSKTLEFLSFSPPFNISHSLSLSFSNTYSHTPHIHTSPALHAAPLWLIIISLGHCKNRFQVLVKLCSNRKVERDACFLPPTRNKLLHQQWTGTSSLLDSEPAIFARPHS